MKNSSFWISLLVFILLMCSCKSKDVATSCSKGLQLASEVNLLAESAKIDTTKTIHSEQLSENKHIVETLIITEYDEKGNVHKKTERKREVKQDSDKTIETIQAVGIEETAKDSLNHLADVSKKVESDTETVTESNFLESFGKYLGIGIAVFLIIRYIWKRIRDK